MRTLKAAVSRELKSWQETNPRSDKFASPWVTKWFMAASRHPVVAALVFLALFAIAAIVTTWCPPPYNGFVTVGPKDIEKFSVDTLFTGLWATQATLVALVYPVGFGFATIFLQKSHATKASLQSYLVTSGAKLTGTCGLALLIGLTLLAAVVSAIPNWTAFAWLILGASFLCLNILLTAKFLLKTFAFATPEARRRERHTYAVNIAWPLEWRKHAAAVIASEPVRFKLIDAEAFTVKGTKPVFHASPVAFQRVVDGQPFSFKGRRLVVNIHYWLVQFVYDRWLRRALKATPAPNKSVFDREGPVFLLRAWPSPEEAEHGEYLAGTSKEPHLSTFEKLLLSWAISYAGRGRFDNDVTVRDCLDEIRAELAQVIGEGASDDFDRQLLALLTLLDDLLEASYCTDDEGKPSNQALTTNSHDRFSGTSVLAIWLASVSDLLKCALAVTSTEPYFASKLVGVPKRLLVRERDVLSSAVRLLYLVKQHEFLQQVIDWGGEQHLHNKASAFPAAELPEPLASRWLNVFIAAIGAWESLKNEAVLPYGDEWAPWGEKGQDELDLLVRHLELSVRSLALASRGPSSTAAMYLIDLLLRWKSQLAIHLEQNNVYIEDPWDLTIEATKRPWDEVRANHLQGREFGSDSALMLEAWSASLANYWRDCCGVLASTVAQEYLDSSVESTPLAAMVLGGLLFGRATVPDSGEGQMRPFADANEFLLSLIRQHIVDGGYREGYRHRLDGVVKMSAKDNWSSFIPGRVMSVRAPDSLEDVRSGQLMSLCLLADERWAPSVAELKAFFSSWANQDARRGELDNLFEVLLQVLQPDFETRFQPLWDAVTSGEKSFADSITRVKSALAAIRKALNEVRTNDIAAAPISPTTLVEYGTSLSEGLELDASGFPFRPKSVSVVDDVAAVPASNLTFTGYPKGRLTDPRLAPGSLDDAKNLLPYVVFRIRANAVDFLTGKADNQLLAGSKAQLLSLIEEFKKCLVPGHEAVLLVPSLREPSWLGQLRRSSSTSVADSAAEFLERKAGYRAERNYVGHIYGAAVYTGMVPNGNLYLLSSHALEVVNLHRLAAARTVTVTAEAAAEDPRLCKLSAHWKISLVKSDEPVWRLPYAAKEVPPPKRRKSPRKRRQGEADASEVSSSA